jgi:hypothetical protein
MATSRMATSGISQADVMEKIAAVAAGPALPPSCVRRTPGAVQPEASRRGVLMPAADGF